MSRKIEKALCDGETVELPNQGWRKGKFYDYEGEGKTLRILCVEVKGGKAQIQLGKLEKDRYPKAGYSQSNYTTVAALGLKGADASVPDEVQERYAEEAMERFNLTHEVVERAEKILYLRRRLQKKFKKAA